MVEHASGAAPLAVSASVASVFSHSVELAVGTIPPELKPLVEVRKVQGMEEESQTW